MIEEVEAGPPPIQARPPVTAFLGETERGPLAPRPVTDVEEYRRWFGRAAAPGVYLPAAVTGFFANGGRCLHVCRLVGAAATTAEARFGDFVLRACGPGRWGNRIWARIEPGPTLRADGSAASWHLRLAYWSADGVPVDCFAQGAGPAPSPAIVEAFDDLRPDERSYVDIDVGSVLVTLRPSPANGIGPARLAPGSRVLEGGADDGAPPGPDDLDGEPRGTRRALQGLAALDQDRRHDLALLYAPNAGTAVARRLVAHCERQRFRFVILDGPAGTAAPDPGTLGRSRHAACFWPWILAADADGGAPAAVPPGGHVAGAYARRDAGRGVARPPADEALRGAVGVVHDLDDRGAARLRRQGVNTIRHLAGRGVRLQGGRTLCPDPPWRHVGVCRLLAFLEHSIDEGTQWVVFEHNDATLRARVVESIRQFLSAQWRLGMLRGPREEDAFFVTCDETTMTTDDIDNGRLICVIGVAPLRPGEFVVFRIQQKTIEAER